jgi:hypothetical protein
MSTNGPRVGRYLIYGLMDPRDGCLFYIGKTHKRREIRLEEHIVVAAEGSAAPVHHRIRAIVAGGARPEIFVLERIAANHAWEEIERGHIARWASFPRERLPYTHPPQTRLSRPTTIRKIEILNVTHNPLRRT